MSYNVLGLVLDDKLYKLINISIVAIAGLFSVFQFTLSQLGADYFKLLLVFGISTFVMLSSFILAIFFSCQGLKTKGYRVRNHDPESYMCEGCIDQEYEFFLYSGCMSMKECLDNNYNQNDKKGDSFNYAINSLLYGFGISTFIFLLGCCCLLYV